MTAEHTALFAKMLTAPQSAPAEGSMRCLVTGDELGPNHVKLDCGHKFNYMAIYNELRMLRSWSGRPYDTNYVTKGEIRCPYCREVTKGVLPYVPTAVPVLTRGLNSPLSLSIGKHTCEHTLVRGARRGQTCGKAAFVYEGKKVCPHHWRAITSGPSEEWSPEHQSIMDNTNCVGLRSALKAAGEPTSGTKKVLVQRVVSKNVQMGNLGCLQAGGAQT